MRYIIHILTFLILANSKVIAQTSTINLYGKTLEIKDTSFHFTEAMQVVFYENNGPLFWNLRAEFRNLNFDHCNHSIQLLLYLDTTGALKDFQLVEGSGLKKIDSIVIEKVMSYSGKLIPVNYNNHYVRSLIYLRFRYFDKETENRLPQNYPKNGSSYLYQNVKITNYTIFSNAPVKTNECEDDLFFYNEGLKCLDQQKFSKAIYNFLQALAVNPRDLEALYNLGISYQKDDNNKKACKCFSEGVEKEDANCIKAFNKFCKEINTR